jgi:hypothetical protein
MASTPLAAAGSPLRRAIRRHEPLELLKMRSCHSTFVSISHADGDGG